MRLVVVTAVLLLVAIQDTLTARVKLPNIGCPYYPNNLCEEGWVQFDDNRCVQYFNTEKTYLDAQACRALSAELVSVHSQRDQDHLNCVTWLTDPDNKPAARWIGAKRSGDEFQYDDGTEFNFDGWAKGQPVKAKNKDCIKMAHNGRAGWRNTKCSDENYYVCAKEIPEPPTFDEDVDPDEEDEYYYYYYDFEY